MNAVKQNERKRYILPYHLQNLTKILLYVHDVLNLALSKGYNIGWYDASYQLGNIKKVMLFIAHKQKN